MHGTSGWAKSLFPPSLGAGDVWHCCRIPHWFIAGMSLMGDGFLSQKALWQVRNIGQTPSFHPKTKWYGTHCTCSLPTQNRVASLLPSSLQFLTPWMMPSPGECSAPSLWAGQYFILFLYIHGCGHCDQSSRESWSCSLCYAMHSNVAECIFLL